MGGLSRYRTLTFRCRRARAGYWFGATGDRRRKYYRRRRDHGHCGAGQSEEVRPRVLRTTNAAK